MIALDTNIAIAYLADEIQVCDRLRRATSTGEILAISTIVVAEILSYPSIDEILAGRIKEWLNGLTIVSFDLAIAEHAAQIRRQARLKLTDSAIAATALIHGASLATRDRGFKKVATLSILEW